MIELTRLNNNPFIINSDLIKLIENTPDTVLTLVTGEKIVVSESSAQVVESIIKFRRKIFSDPSRLTGTQATSSVGMTRQIPQSGEKS
jgi:flagellar protein FlbD